VHIKQPLLRIPNLAIHLNRTANENFKINAEEHTVPILGMTAAAELNKETEAVSVPNAGVSTPTMMSKHHPVLLEILAGELRCEVEQIQDFELSLYDTHPAAVGGVDNAFIFSPRLDNQSVYEALHHVMQMCSLVLLFSVVLLCNGSPHRIFEKSIVAQEFSLNQGHRSFRQRGSRISVYPRS
jgi:aspartyl aminopeptidase